MLIGLAVETWAPAHSGDSGVAWWVARGLAIKGHSVQVLTTRSRDESTFSGVAVSLLPARFPAADESTMARRRAACSAGALVSVQKELADRMGATSDLARTDVGRYDLLVGIGVRSPHVRDVMRRALGTVAGVWHLTAEDIAVCAMPLLGECTLGHSLVSHWSELSVTLATVLGREVSCVTPPAEDALASSDSEALADEMGVPPEYLLWVPADGALPPAPPAQGSPATVVLDEATLHTRRLDPVVARAGAVVIEDDAGDLAVVARRSAVPVVILAGCAGAHWVAGSASGMVVANSSELPGAAVSAFSSRARGRANPAGGEALVPAYVWARWYESQV